MIIWSFKGTDTKFRSTPAKHQRDIFKMAQSCGVSPETEIIYHNGNPNKQPIKDTFAINDSTSDSTQPTVPKATKTRKPRRKKTNSVQPVSKLLDRDSAVDDYLAGADRSSSTSGRGNSLDD